MIEKIKSNSWLFTFLSFIICLLGYIKHSWDTVGGIIANMTSDIFNIVVIVIIFLGAIISFIRWNTQLLRNILSERDKELKQVKLEYNKLVELAKLPKTSDRAITVESRPDYPAIITNHYGKFPNLRFNMRVINRTYYPYEAEEAVAKCFCGREEVYKGTWDNNTKKSETFELVTNLPVWGEGDGSIEYHVPIKRLYDDMTTWRLSGTVKYKSRKPLIDNDNQYATPKIDIDLVYRLSKKQMSELKKEVEKAIGETKK